MNCLHLARAKRLRSHENMSFGSFGVFNLSKLQVELFYTGKKRLKSVSYAGQYVVFSDTPNYKQVNHSISYRWYLKKVNHE